jgi:DNA (cytosine-5)-methyltransferase 1
MTFGNNWVSSLQLSSTKIRLSMRKYNVLDLFSGCGGLSKGFQDDGFHVSAGIDFDPIALKTFELNHNGAQSFCEDMGTLDVKKFLKKTNLGKIDVIVGGPPCQGFSISGKRNIDDPRNGYYRSYFKFVDLLSPEVFVMENVPNLISMGKGAYKDQILELFKSLGYTVNFQVLLASNYGVPQNRKRVFFVGTKSKRNNFLFPVATHGENGNDFITTKDAISDLPDTNLVDGSKYLYKPMTKYQRLIRQSSSGVFNHQLTEHSEQTVKIISLVPDGGNFKNLPAKYQSIRNVNIAWTRYASNKPSFTIDTGHRHHFHYEYNRVPTVRESARLQSFPDSFIFTGSKTNQYKHVGNAVPPLLAKIIANNVREQLL